MNCLMISVVFFIVLSLFAPARASAETEPIECTFGIAVHSVSRDEYLRHVGPDTAGHLLGPDEYYNFYMDFRNNGSTALKGVRADFIIDGERAPFGPIDIGPGAAVSLHFLKDFCMSLSRGEHTWTASVNGVVRARGTFRLPRDWNSLMPLPTAKQIAAFRRPNRSPYIVVMPYYGIESCTEYYTDLRADHLPRGTYVCPLSWGMESPALRKKYAKAEFGGGYCGLQVWEDGTHAAILTIWDTFLTDPNGKVTKIVPRVLYPEGEGDVCDNTSEGSFAHCLVPYDWQAGKDYRLHLQLLPSPQNGRMAAHLSICDLETGVWTRLISIDTGLTEDTYMYGAMGFLENYIPQYMAEVRTMELSNMWARSWEDGTWHAVSHTYFGINASSIAFDYVGSFNFGTDKDTAWVITSGVQGLGELPSDKTRFPVKQGTWHP